MVERYSTMICDHAADPRCPVWCIHRKPHCWLPREVCKPWTCAAVGGVEVQCCRLAEPVPLNFAEIEACF